MEGFGAGPAWICVGFLIAGLGSNITRPPVQISFPFMRHRIVYKKLLPCKEGRLSEGRDMYKKPSIKNLSPASYRFICQ